MRPLDIAINEGNFFIAHTLLDAGAKVTPGEFEYGEQVGVRDGEQVSERNRSPLQDTIGTALIGVEFYGPQKTRAPDAWWQARTAMLSRLIEMGVDMNGIDYTGDRPITPMELAVHIGDVNDMATLLAAGAKVEYRMLKIACFPSLEGWNDKMKCLLAHGLRLDVPMEMRLDGSFEFDTLRRLRGESMLQATADLAAETENPELLHELLVLSSPDTLSRGHLDKVFESCISDGNGIASDVLFRHGAHISCRNKPFRLTLKLIRTLTTWVRGGYGTDDLFVGEAELDPCIRITIDMGLPRADQCLFFFEALRKRQAVVAHHFLDRNLARTDEAAEYFSAHLMLAADMGDISIIRRLWSSRNITFQKAKNLRSLQLLFDRAVIHGNEEMVTFFLDYGASPHHVLSPAQALEETKMLHNTYQAALKTETCLGTNVSPDNVAAYREYLRAQLHLARFNVSKAELLLSPLQLAVRHGHRAIIRELLERADLNTVVKSHRMYIP